MWHTSPYINLKGSYGIFDGDFLRMANLYLDPFDRNQIANDGSAPSLGPPIHPSVTVIQKTEKLLKTASSTFGAHSIFVLVCVWCVCIFRSMFDQACVRAGAVAAIFVRVFYVQGIKQSV